jgi:ABC-type bacteriocin/lantibiotic exporter with double-glycine peptidase domain
MIRFIAAGIISAALSTIIVAASETEDKQKLNNIVCGPRCVQYVLKQFDQEVELADIVREMQWTHLTDGYSAASIVTALEKRGLFVKTIQIDPQTTVLTWDHLIILHLKPENDESLGHFVVRIPQATNDNIVIVDGLAGVYSTPYSEFCKKMSGVVLLCSLTPIADDVVVVYHRIVIWHWGIGLIGLAFGIAFFHRRYVRSRNGP